MRFSYLFTGFLLPALVFSTPTPAAADEISNVEMAARAADISSLLGDFNSVLGLLKPEFLNNVQGVVNHLALLLDDKTTKQTKALINTADGLLSGPLLGQLTSLLTKDFVTAIGNLIKNANNLLTPQFVASTTGLINDIAPVSPIHKLL